jgi:hypothetical protein
MYNWTPEQEAFFKAVLEDHESFVKLAAVAGASKTTSLVEVARRFKQSNPDGTFRYLVFGSANSREAKESFGSNAECSTLHSLAYQAIVPSYGLKLPIANFISYRDIPSTVKRPFGIDIDALTLIEDFNCSRYLTLDSYLDSLEKQPLDSVVTLAQQLLVLMADGQMKCSHSFYLKLFHIAIMTGTYTPEEVDILAVDEAGDLTHITLDIFRKYPAKQKIMVGDRYQAIFKWMGCVNGFEVLRDEGISLPLPKSFRCSTAIAERVQSFMQTYINSDFIFKGMDYDHQRIESRAYLTRTNAALISKMIDLDSLNIPYRLATQAKVQQIFSLPLALIYLTPGKKQYNPELKYLQEDVDEWASSKSLQEDFTKLKYIAHMHKDNPNVQAAVQLIAVYGPQRIIDLSKSAESHKYSDDGVYLMTAHTSKG